MRVLRRRQGLSQAALASRMRQLGCNLTDTAITKIEGGSRDVSLEEALTLAAALGVAPVHLVFPIDERATRLFDVPGAYRYAALQWAIGNRPPRWGYHGLRHYFATLLIHGGASVKTVQLALGHSTPTITLNTYPHEWPDALDRTRSLVDAALGNVALAAAVARG